MKLICRSFFVALIASNFLAPSLSYGSSAPEANCNYQEVFENCLSQSLDFFGPNITPEQAVVTVKFCRDLAWEQISQCMTQMLIRDYGGVLPGPISLPSS